MRAVAIIPARGGSKRIPRKNIRPFLGRPIIEYAIEAALSAGCFDEVMVSTDDVEIAGVAQALGANVPFPRSAATANDTATTTEVLNEVIEGYRMRGRDFDLGCCLYPTAVFVTAAQLRAGREPLLADPCVQCVVPVLRFAHPIQRALRLDHGQLSMLAPENASARSQDLTPAFHDAGQWYWFRTAALANGTPLLNLVAAGMEIGELDAQDIDNESDWRLAEMKFRFRCDQK